MLNANFVLHACHGAPELVRNDGNVHIYFFGYSYFLTEKGINVYREHKILRKIFSFSVPGDKLSYGNSISKCDVQGDNVGKCFKSGEKGGMIKSDSDGVAEVSSRNLWILFDIAHAPWHGDRFVLEKIIKMSLSRLIPGTPHDLIWKKKPVSVFQSLRKRTIPELFSDGHAGSLGIFKKISMETLAENEKKSLADKERLTMAYMKARTDIMSSIVKLEAAETELKKVPKTMPSKKEFEKEFKEILSWNSINGIKIINDKIYVFTKLLKTVRYDKANNLTLAEYAISLKLPGFLQKSTDDITGGSFIFIEEIKDGWKGEYKSHFSTMSLTFVCFGTLRESVLNAMSNNDIKGVVQLLVSFIVGDSNSPQKREDASVSKGEYACKPIYADSEELERSCLEYVGYMNKKVIESKKEFISKKISELKDAIDKNIKISIDIRSELQDKTRELNYIRKSFEEMSSLEKEFRKLTFCSNLYHLLLRDEWIEASFVGDESKEESIIIFTQPKLGVMNVTLPDQDGVISMDFTHENPKFSYESRKEILKLISIGKVGSAMMAALELATKKIIEPSRQISRKESQ